VKARRLAALSAGSVLFVLFLLADSPRELARRAQFVAHSASKDLAVRRLSGSGASFDRSFYVFIESVRRSLPRGAPGVVLSTPRPSTQELYLATYVLAPVPVRLASGSAPPRWLAAIYRQPPPSEWRVLARLPGGVLASAP
jgi:hypothetical protein